MPSLYASPSCVYPLTLTPLAFFPNLSTRHPPCVRTLSTRHSHVGTAHRGTAHIAPGLQAPTRGEGRDPKQTANTARPAGRQDNFDLRISTNAGHYLCDFIYFSSLAHLWKAGQYRRVVFLHVPSASDGPAVAAGRELTLQLIRAICDCERTRAKRHPAGAQ